MLNVLALNDPESCMIPKFTDAHDISLFYQLTVAIIDCQSAKSRSSSRKTLQNKSV